MIGQTLGQYRVTAEVARGGQATVYRAMHLVLGRDVALKVLHPHLITVADFLQKFTSEAQILARLKHPHIVQVYDAGYDQARGLYYIAMEWLDGQTVDALITQQGRLAVDLAVRIADQVAAALEYAHAQGLIHRDIKPANIMLLPDSAVKVLDFGIAAIIAAGQKAVTRIGTVEYMALEQFHGQADARSDLYSLGACLYHMLTGELPPKLALQPPTPPRQLNPAIPAGLEAFLYRTLTRDPGGRPQTTAAFRQELQAAWTAAATQPAAFVRCLSCGVNNRAGAKYCSKCGDFLIPQRLQPGVVLAGRYQITGTGVKPRRTWDVTSFEARDLQTGTQCRIIPMGATPVEDQWIRQLVGLRHRTLPKMEIAVDKDITCFIFHAVPGVPLDSASIQDASHLISVGLQLCDLLEATGSSGAGFSWLALQAPHVMLDSQGHIMIDSFQYCYDWLHERRLETFGTHVDRERKLPPFLNPFAYYGYEDRETGEVGIVGGVMALPLFNDYPYHLPDQPLVLRRKMPGIPPHLEQAILGSIWGTARGSNRPWIGSLAEFRQHLLGRIEGPARATVSPQRVKLGKVLWGESSTSLVRISSRSPGLLYGQVEYTQEGLSVQPRTFVGTHPYQTEIRVSLDTSKLETCGALDSAVLITTGIDSFKIVVLADILPSAAFHRTQAQKHLGRTEWALALSHCKQLITLEPSGFEGYWLRGQAYYGLAQYANAVNDYTEAIRLNPQKPELYWARSLVYEAQGQKHNAIDDLQQYLSLGGVLFTDAWKRIAELQQI